MSATQSTLGAAAGKAALDKVGRLAAAIAHGRGHKTAAADAGETGDFHQPSEALAADGQASLDKFGMDARAAIGPVRGRVNGADALDQRSVACRARRRRPFRPRIVTAGGDAQHTAHGGDRKNGPVCAHESDPSTEPPSSPERTRPRLLIPPHQKNDSCCAAAIPQATRIVIPCPHDLEGGHHDGADDKRRPHPCGPAQAGKAEANARVARRLLAIANALSGMSRKEAAEAAGMDRQTLRDWVIRYNAHGLDGLYDCWGDGRPPRLEPQEQAELIRIVLAGPDPERRPFGLHARGPWCASAKTGSARRLHPASMGRLLRRLGLSRQKARPSHPQKDPAQAEAFKKSPGASEKTSVYA